MFCKILSYLNMNLIFYMYNYIIKKLFLKNFIVENYYQMLKSPFKS